MDEKETKLMDKIVEKLKTVYDPEIPVDIYELGLIYDVRIDQKKATLDMTLTSPHCPVAETLPMQVKRTVEEISELDEVEVKIVWEPPWDKTKMSEAARLELGL
ncbi:MAG: FeS assembly SUF system protein [Pelagibacteraceae bacterium]|jgi:FeS assembly SUF system protein|nr:FeS assembly SUF system protein [Pelagibacteraceae bacterium]|tara:strand:+ start:1116 stop:1427 length:312 start_codon:yes stop_codon:yes gene_type:complete